VYSKLYHESIAPNGPTAVAQSRSVRSHVSTFKVHVQLKSNNARSSVAAIPPLWSAFTPRIPCCSKWFPDAGTFAREAMHMAKSPAVQSPSIPLASVRTQTPYSMSIAPYPDQAVTSNTTVQPYGSKHAPDDEFHVIKPHSSPIHSSAYYAYDDQSDSCISYDILDNHPAHSDWVSQLPVTIYVQHSVPIPRISLVPSYTSCTRTCGDATPNVTSDPAIAQCAFSAGFTQIPLTVSV
jgi:hypothetical protein